MSDRPKFPVTHPAMRTAMNIVNQILDEAGTDVSTRQRINDDCDQFVAWMLDEHAKIAARAAGGTWFTCPRCQMTSFNPNDVRVGYCGNCRDWTGDEGARHDPL